MSYTSRSKVATLDRIEPFELARELHALGIQCEYPKCTDPASAVAESGTSMLLCTLHKAAHSESSYTKRLIEQARITDLMQEVYRTVAAAFSDPGEIIHYDGSESLASQVFDSVEKVVADIAKRDALPDAPVVSPVVEDPKKGTSTLSSLFETNGIITPFFL